MACLGRWSCSVAASLLVPAALAAGAVGGADGVAGIRVVEGGGEVFADRVAIKLAPGVTSEQLSLAFAGSGGSELDALCVFLRAAGAVEVAPAIQPPPKDAALASRLGLDRVAVVRLGPGADAVGLGAALARRFPQVEAAEAEPVGRAHSLVNVNDPLFPSAWHLENTGQSVYGVAGVPGADVRARAAWSVARTVPSATVTVAVLDTGVSLSHPDVGTALVPGRNFLSSTAPLAYDDASNLSHGTYCAGIIAATLNNSIGVAGAAPPARVMPVKMLTSSRTGTQTTCSSAVIWAADQGAGVISMSLGWGAPSSTGVLGAALVYAAAREVVVCASVGNTPGASVSYPASDPLVIAVGGTDNRDRGFTGGTTGPEMSLSAPAVGVVTTCDDSVGGADSYTVVDGTSMACPVVAAGSALVRSINPLLTAPQVRSMLESTADDLGTPGRDPVFGFGRVNFERAARAAVLSIPCRADMDRSGARTIDDLFLFLSYYFVGDPRADFDVSLSVSIDDLFTYLNAWFAGC